MTEHEPAQEAVAAYLETIESGENPAPTLEALRNFIDGDWQTWRLECLDLGYDPHEELDEAETLLRAAIAKITTG